MIIAPIPKNIQESGIFSDGLFSLFSSGISNYQLLISFADGCHPRGLFGLQGFEFTGLVNGDSPHHKSQKNHNR